MKKQGAANQKASGGEDVNIMETGQNLIERTGFPVEMAIIWLEFSGEVATNYTAWKGFFAAKCQVVSAEFIYVLIYQNRVEVTGTVL